MPHYTNTENPVDFPHMTKQLYIIQYESAHFNGGEQQCVVWAHNAEDAELEAMEHMDVTMYELFQDEYEDERDHTGYSIYDDEPAYVVNWCEPLTGEHAHWEDYIDPTQQEFYPQIGTPL